MMKCYIIFTTLDTEKQPVEVHLVREDAMARVQALTDQNEQRYWYVTTPLCHRLFVVTEQGVPTGVAVASETDNCPLRASIGAEGNGRD